MTVKDIVIDLSEYSDDGYSTENLEDYTYESIESLIPCGSVSVESAYGAPELPIGGCATTKYSGYSINLQSSPDDAVAPYFVRFWRKPTSAGVMAWQEIGSVRTVFTDGGTVSDSFTLYDLDVASAIGQIGALTPGTDTAGNITESGATASLAVGKIRVATTVYDSCPTTPKVCLSYCDVTLGCFAPTCNFTVL